MSKIKLYTGNVLIAMFLMVVLSGSILIKPAHILFIYHEQSEIIHPGLPQNVILTEYNHDCLICDFVFCSFIPQEEVAVPQVNIVSFNKLVTRTVACIICKCSHNFQLRAPPSF